MNQNSSINRIQPWWWPELSTGITGKNTPDLFINYLVFCNYFSRIVQLFSDVRSASVNPSQLPSLTPWFSLFQGPRLELDEIRNFNDEIKKEKRVSAATSSIPACAPNTKDCERSKHCTVGHGLWILPSWSFVSGAASPIVSHGGRFHRWIILVFFVLYKRKQGSRIAPLLFFHPNPWNNGWCSFLLLLQTL